MGIFKKKKLPFEFKILVFVPSVDSMQLQTSVDSILFRDPKDQLLYIVDTATKGETFKEIFPGENKKNFDKEEIENLKKALSKKRESLKSQNPKDNLNTLNLKKEISQIEEILKKYQEPKGSFVIQDNKGQKSIYFIRKSTGNFPMHWDIHNNTAFSPTEKNSRDLFNSWKTKYENLKKDERMPFEKVTQVVAALVLAVIIIVLGILAWNWLQYDLEEQKAREIQKYICQDETLQNLDIILETNRNTSLMLNDFVQQFSGGGTNPVQAQTETLR